MMELLAKLPTWVMDIPTYLGVLVIIATALVRLPGLNKFEGRVNSVVKVIQKILSWLPTLGKNPGTAALEKKVSGG